MFTHKFFFCFAHCLQVCEQERGLQEILDFLCEDYLDTYFLWFEPNSCCSESFDGAKPLLFVDRGHNFTAVVSACSRSWVWITKGSTSSASRRQPSTPSSRFRPRWTWRRARAASTTRRRRCTARWSRWCPSRCSGTATERRSGRCSTTGACAVRGPAMRRLRKGSPTLQKWFL